MLVDIVFLILKILGIILLVILGILVLIISAMFLLPAKYRMTADAEGDLKHSSLVLKMYWLFRLVEADVSYKNGEFDWKARILWITETEEKSQTKTPQLKAKKESIDETDFETKDETPEDSLKSDKKRSQKKKEKKTTFRQFIDKIKYTIKNICAKIKKAIEIKDEVIAFLNDETHRSTFRKFKKAFLTILKHYRPRKMKGNLRFGFEDPYHTGQALAALSLIYPFYGKDVEVHPDFDQKILEGHIVISGHIRTGHLLRLVILWIFDKDVKQTYQYFANFK